jgi:putative molybdopterin biosynthesis protein
MNTVDQEDQGNPPAPLVTSVPLFRDLPASAALEAWYSTCATARCPGRVDTVRLQLSKAVGLVTAEPVWALRSSPAFEAAAMDGIALRSADTVGASDTNPMVLPSEAFEVVDTGDPVSELFDSVVMREHVSYVAGGVELRAPAVPYQHVRLIGEDISATELLLSEGHRLRAVDVAACGAAGLTELLVRRRPIVAVIPTGDEIRPIGTDIVAGELHDTNSLMLAAQASEIGCEAVVLPIEPDDPKSIGRAVLAAVTGCDLVIIVAGSSAGRDDHTASVIGKLGLLAVHGVAVRPGHPVVLGAIEATPVIGAPGYPVSAALTFEIFAAPLLGRLQGTVEQSRPVIEATLGQSLSSPIGMDDWVRVRLGRVKDRLVATLLPRGAAALTSLVNADGLLLVPAGLDGYDTNSNVKVRLLRGQDEIEHSIVVIGSHEIALDLAASMMRRIDPRATLASSSVGSLGGLVAVRDGLCHLAGSCLFDPDTGEYTLPFVRNTLAGRDVAVIRLVRREQGLIVARGNPLGLRGVADLGQRKLRFVNRQRGSGTRALLGCELGRMGIDSSSVFGYERQECTDLAVAASVAAGRADAGLGVRAAARALGLDFVPVTFEPYDLVLDVASLEDPVVRPLWELMASPDFRSAVEALGGYDTTEMGERII